MSEQFQQFLKKERFRLFVFLIMIFIIKVFPTFFSFSGTSHLYEKYYENSLPISLPNLLIITYFIRLFLVLSYNFWKEKRRKKGVSQMNFGE
jgi:ABC-type transport system involved in multi-copper enzyme maturation permease subunit